jgi:hypothetical protein
MLTVTLHPGGSNMAKIRELGSEAREFWNRHPTLDVAISFILLSIHLLLVYLWGVSNILGGAESQQRLTVYGAGAGVMSLIAGFTGTAIAQYSGSSGPAIYILRQQFGKIIRINWASIIRWLLICAVICLICMIIDGKSSPRAAEWLFQFALIIAVGKFCRLAFLLRLTMAAIDSGQRQSTKPVPTLTTGKAAKRSP